MLTKAKLTLSVSTRAVLATFADCPCRGPLTERGCQLDGLSRRRQLSPPCSSSWSKTAARPLNRTSLEVGWWREPGEETRALVSVGASLPSWDVIGVGVTPSSALRASINSWLSCDSPISVPEATSEIVSETTTSFICSLNYRDMLLCQVCSRNSWFERKP